MRRNAKLHLYIETPLKEALIQEAEICGLTLSELVRQRLRNRDQLSRMEALMLSLIRKSNSDN